MTHGADMTDIRILKALAENDDYDDQEDDCGNKS